MKNFRSTGAWMAGCLAVCTATLAAEPASVANPYTTITSRNMFGLELIGPLPPAPTPAVPQIMLRGFMTIFGSEQVLFEVAEGSSGQAARKSYFVLKESETQDGITFVRIDSKTDEVIFENHGALQRFSLSPTAATGTRAQLSF